MISKWRDDAGKEYMTLDLVYQKTGQLRDMSFPDDSNPPGIYSIHLNGLSADENGLYDADEVLERISTAISAYDELEDEYEQENAA